jgi:hypothetical protein
MQKPLLNITIYFILREKMAIQRITIAMILAIVVLGTVLTALSVLITTRTTYNTGGVTAIGMGVYWDSGCTSVVTSIDWGIFDPGTSKNVTVYVKDEGTVNIVLNLTTNSWSPVSASSYMTLTWNREGYLLTPSSVVQAVFTLSVSSSVSNITYFSFNSVITGTEQT